MKKKHVLITGGSGFIGRHLAYILVNNNHNITIVSREPEKVQHRFRSLMNNNPSQVKLIADLSECDEPPTHIVSLAGAGIADKRWTEERKLELLNSRIESIQHCHEWLQMLKLKIDGFLCGSAIGYYGYAKNPEHNFRETSPHYQHYTHELCTDVEIEAMKLSDHCKRICLLRTGVVIGNNGGALAKMRLPALMGLNGRIGNGKQYISWIHMFDLVHSIQMLINNPRAKGPYNLVSPIATTNKELSRAIARALKQPLQMPIPASMLKLMMGEASDLLIKGQKVIPYKLQKSGYEFKYTDINEAVKQAFEYWR